jgi:proline racemase
VVHPLVPELNHIYGTIISGAPRHAGSTQANCCIFADRQVDRSPTGSGTAGRIAQLVARGELAMDEPFQNESVIGTIMRGRALRRTTVGQYEAVIPEVSGQASIHGFANWVLDDRDPLKNGFLVR